jgi:hypothetical protein
MNNGPHKTFEIGMAASGRLFSSYFSLRNVAARRPVSGFEIGVRLVAGGQWVRAA